MNTCKYKEKEEKSNITQNIEALEMIGKNLKTEEKSKITNVKKIEEKSNKMNSIFYNLIECLWRLVTL